MKSIFTGLIIFTFVINSQATNRAWVNTAGGNWFDSSNWSPAGVPQPGDTVLITNNGTYTVTILTNVVTVGNLFLGGASGTQTLLNGTINNLTMTNYGLVNANGVLTVTNGGLAGFLTVATGGQLNFGTASTISLYNFALTNQGTVNWSGSLLYVGGSNQQTTYITNSGFWQMTTSDQLANGGGSTPTFYNAGIVSKITSAGTSTFNNINFINLPTGNVNVTVGTLLIYPATTNYFVGTFTATSPAIINFYGGNYSDAGGIVTGSGTIQCSGGNFYLRTNTVPGLKITAGEIYINTNTFQLAGAITNLTIDGPTLHGTNQVAGTLTFNSGSLVGKLTVQPSAQLVFATIGSKLLYGLNLINQGTVDWNAGNMNVGGSPPTIISNGGTWLMNGDNTFNLNDGSLAGFTNSGTLRKSAGTVSSSSTFSGFPVINQPNGLIQVDSGNLYFYYQGAYTNYSGILRLNGGQFQAFNAITLVGGTLDGSGNVLANALIGGTISPGQNGPGTIGFPSGLNLGSNATLVIDGTSTSQYDQLYVTGAVSIANCTLQISSLPTVPLGTTFTIINNDGSDAVSGTFKNLPENSLINVSGQIFKIHYTGGTGNDVTLVRDNGASGTTLVPGNFTNGIFHFTGNGFNSTVFTIQASTNFIQWTNIGTATSDMNGLLIFTDTNAPKFRYRFYRTTN